VCVCVFFQCDYSCCCIEGENAQNSKSLVSMIINLQNFQCVKINLETLGNLLYITYFILFLFSSLILLVAMIGAIVLIMHKTT